MKKICFVCYGNLYLAPYIDNYLSLTNTQCDILVWNRHLINEEKENHNVIAFNKVVKDNGNSVFLKVKKMFAYLRYSRFVNRILKRNCYDVVIFLQSIGAVFSQGLLLRKYKGKYIVDIRDYSIEGIGFLYKKEKKLLKNSAVNVISSEGYRNFLPNDDRYLLVHNYNSGIPIMNEMNPFTRPYRLAFIGLIRFQEQNKKIISLFANDERFHVSFIGKNAYELKNFVKNNGIGNVTLIDQFSPNETLKYYNGTDVVLNVYGNHTPLLDYALSNKLYFAAALKKPILVSKDTFMAEISVKNGFGFVLDFEDEKIKDKLENYLEKMNLGVFITKCNDFIEKVKIDNVNFEQEMKKCLN